MKHKKWFKQLSGWPEKNTYRHNVTFSEKHGTVYIFWNWDIAETQRYFMLKVKYVLGLYIMYVNMYYILYFIWLFISVFTFSLCYSILYLEILWTEIKAMQVRSIDKTGWVCTPKQI